MEIPTRDSSARLLKSHKRPVVLIRRNDICMLYHKLETIPRRISLISSAGMTCSFWYSARGRPGLASGSMMTSLPPWLESLVKTAEHCGVSLHLVVCIHDENRIEMRIK
jgi:hypothetical protein